MIIRRSESLAGELPLLKFLRLSSCPHCGVSHPNLEEKSTLVTTDHTGSDRRIWRMYVCRGCGGVVSAWSPMDGGPVIQYFPSALTAHSALPEDAKAFLQQAMDTLHAPSGSIMLAASAVDAMLKAKGYTEGSLCRRINQATADHLITDEMATWAHRVRLDANTQRHADEAVGLPDQKDAKHTLAFAEALGRFLFVLPSMIQQGLKDTAPTE